MFLVLLTNVVLALQKRIYNSVVSVIWRIPNGIGLNADTEDSASVLW